MIDEYYHNQSIYQKMQDYYDGKHDIFITETTSPAICVNYIGKLVMEEVQYVFANPITYISKDGEEEVLKVINKEFNHWSATHEQDLLRNLEIFGRVYTLNYIDSQGRFGERILSPLNANLLCDSNGIPQIFIHFYKKDRFSNVNCYDIYTPDRVEIYEDKQLIKTKPNIFKNGIPVSYADINESETIYKKIKSLNDSLNQIITDQTAIINSYKNAYLVVTNMDVNDTINEDLKKKQLIKIPSKDSSVSWLIKNVDSTYIDNMIKEIQKEIYALTYHIANEEMPTSNTSSLALRSRLTFLESRCSLMFHSTTNVIYDRLRFLFEYLSLKGTGNYDYNNLSLKYSPCVPQDVMYQVQIISQLADKLSLQTALSLLPFISNPEQEIEKIKKEAAESQSVDLDKLGLNNNE